MKLKMNHSIALALFSIIVIIALEGVQGRTLAQRPIITQMIQIGQEYDCVDFYKQPAFDHPSLRHLVPKARLNSTMSVQGKFNSESGGCPDGTVPIRRSVESLPPPNSSLIAMPHCYAIVLTNTNNNFYGSRAQASIYKPTAHSGQSSSARIKLINGADTIEAGWMVNPDFFKDNEAHLYTRFKAGPNTECINFECPGFVQVAQNIPLGSTSHDYSTTGGKQFFWTFSIDKHKDDGNWWLSMTIDPIGTHQIGYWPSSLFTGLKDAATQAQWGGEIFNLGPTEPPPSMGSGFMAEFDQSWSAYFQQITVVDGSLNNVVPHGTDTFYDCPQLYTVLDWGDQGGDHGRVIFYWGPRPSD